MARRSFAGYVCGESLSVGLFGECFRAQNKSGAVARVLVVDNRLSQRKRFSTALARHGPKVSELSHPHIVTTKMVGRARDGCLVVISSPVEAPVDLRALLERAKGALPVDIALSIGMGAIRGLSHAHELGIVHGGVHPRSVLIDSRGVSKLSDFGLARALACAAADAEDSELLAGLRGYVAPEIALGQEPDVLSDVYAAGALVSQLVWNDSTPPDNQNTPLASAVRQAIDTDSARRFESAIQFESALRQSVSDSNQMVAQAAKVSEFMRDVAQQIDAGLDAETEDLLSSLGLAGPVPSAALENALAGLGDEFRGLEDSVEDVDPADITVAEFSQPDGADYDEELTTVDAESSDDLADPVEAIIRDNVPQPSLGSAGASRSMLEAPDDYDVADETPLPVPRPFHEDGTHVGALVDLVGRQAATSSPFEDGHDLPDAKNKRSNTLRWLALIAFVAATLVAVAYTKTGIFKAQKDESEARTAKQKEEYEKAQPKPGQVSIHCATEDAAVWLLLGRTPARSFTVSSAQVHELRLEHEGFRPMFLAVSAANWSGEGEERQAKLSASLAQAADAELVLPPFPPEHDPPLAAGGPGQGVLVIESDPVGAEVWLWVGTTPEARVTGIEAGKDYEFKILKDGHRPAFAAFKTQDWYLSGSEGPMRPGLHQEVVLEPLGEEPGAEPGAEPGKAGKTSDEEESESDAEGASDSQPDKSPRGRRRNKRK